MVPYEYFFKFYDSLSDVDKKAIQEINIFYLNFYPLERRYKQKEGKTFKEYGWTNPYTKELLADVEKYFNDSFVCINKQSLTPSTLKDSGYADGKNIAVFCYTYDENSKNNKHELFKLTYFFKHIRNAFAHCNMKINHSDPSRPLSDDTYFELTDEYFELTDEYFELTDEYFELTDEYFEQVDEYKTKDPKKKKYREKENAKISVNFQILCEIKALIESKSK